MQSPPVAAASSSSTQVTLLGDRLEERGGQLGGHRAGEGAGDGLGLVRAGGEDHDRPRRQDRGDAHGQGPGNDVIHAAELPGRVGAGDRVQLDQPGRQPQGFGDGQVARLVESRCGRCVRSPEAGRPARRRPRSSGRTPRRARPRMPRGPCRRARARGAARCRRG